MITFFILSYFHLETSNFCLYCLGIERFSGYTAVFVNAWYYGIFFGGNSFTSLYSKLPEINLRFTTALSRLQHTEKDLGFVSSQWDGRE